MIIYIKCLKDEILGVGVGKDSLAIAFQIAEDTWQHYEYTNNTQGIGQFIEEFPFHKMSIHVIVESTGVYSKKLVHHLCENGIAVFLLNPKQSSVFAKVMLCARIAKRFNVACKALYD